MSVEVVAGSRLHAGFYYVGSRLEMWSVRLAGAGFYIDYPRVVVRGSVCDEVKLEGFSDLSETVREYLSRVGVKTCLKLVEKPLRHFGLGSTTQILLASLLAALRAGGVRVSVDDVIELAGRPRKYSSIGSLLFKHGGFVVEQGVPRERKPYKPLLRLRVPESWRFIIVLPRAGRGAEETVEDRLMSRVFSKEHSAEARLLMALGCLRLSSGIARRDLDDALAGLAAMQRGTGMVFSDLQGGVYREDLWSIVESAGKMGLVLAQSSWGPTLYTIARARESNAVRGKLEKVLEKTGIEGEVVVTAPRNRGASVAVQRER